jgi:hypothetical protein
MYVTTEQLAEILAGIARAQTAIVDAIESNEGGWRNSHFIPKITSAANLRLKDARLIDIPSRVLLRAQSRVPMPPEQILKDLETALANMGVTSAAAPAAAQASAAAPAAATTQADDDLNFFNT